MSHTPVVPDPPCDTCKNKQKCREEKLCCEVYAYYASSESHKTRLRVKNGFNPCPEPCKAIYRRIFDDG